MTLAALRLNEALLTTWSGKVLGETAAGWGL